MKKFALVMVALLILTIFVLLLLMDSPASAQPYPTQLPIMEQMWCKSGYFEPFPYPAPGSPNGQLVYCWDATLTPYVITLTPAPTLNATQQAATMTAAVLTSTVYDLTTTVQPTHTRTPTLTYEPTETEEEEEDDTPTPTDTASPTFTATATDTSTPTDTPTPTYTLTFTPTPSFTPSLTPSPTPRFSIVIDHNSVALFDQIPAQYRDAAKNTRFLFSDRSVGVNIDEALNCLQAPTWGTSPAYCRRDYTAFPSWRTFTQADLTAGVVPARILFNPDPALFSRANWTHVTEGGSYYYEITQNWLQSIATPNLNNYDVFMQQFSYLTAAPGQGIVDAVPDEAGNYDLEVGYFSRTDPLHFNIVNYEGLINANPSKTFIFSTSSLARNNGSADSNIFNNRMREYAAANGKILFDMADIESHTDTGAPCFTNSLPAICADYTTETSGGHLGSVSAGKIAIAKALWVLLAELNGWRP